jgi:hypothetical protein
MFTTAYCWTRGSDAAYLGDVNEVRLVRAAFYLRRFDKHSDRKRMIPALSLSERLIRPDR